MNELEALLAGLDAAVQSALDEAAQEACDYAASLTKGELAKSITFRRVGAHGREIFSPKSYAGFVENGRPGFSARGKCLRFVINGEVLFRKSVGPAAPRPFLAPAQAFLERVAAERVEQAIARLL